MSQDQPSAFSEQEVQQRFERIGRDLVERELYAEAIEAYKDLVRDFPRSRWAANALMGIAECFHHLGQSDEELRTLEAIAEQFPDHIVAKRAQAALRLLRGSDAPPPQEAMTVTGFSRQANRLRAQFLQYSLVSWVLSLVVLGAVLLTGRGGAPDNTAALREIKQQASDIETRLDALEGVRPAPEPAQSPPPAPAPSVSPPAPSRPSPPPVSRQPATYTVKSGDTLWQIARTQLGDANRAQEIADRNGLKAPFRLHVGDKLTLPPR